MGFWVIKAHCGRPVLKSNDFIFFSRYFLGYLDFQTPSFMNEFLLILGQAATPSALFAIGASLSFRKIDNPISAFWLSFLQLFGHPLLVGIMAFYL